MILNEKLDEILKETMQVIFTSQHVGNIIISSDRSSYSDDGLLYIYVTANIDNQLV